MNEEKQLIVEFNRRISVHPERHRAGRREIWRRSERRSSGEKRKKKGGG